MRVLVQPGTRLELSCVSENINLLSRSLVTPAVRDILAISSI